MSNLSMSLDRRFQIKQNGSTVRTEILAGITTFATMSYVLATIPNMLEQAGLVRGAVLTMLIIAVVACSVAMALYTNRPFCLAPGMSSVAILSSIDSIGMTPEVAFGIIFWEGVIFVIISFAGLRNIIATARQHQDRAERRHRTLYRPYWSQVRRHCCFQPEQHADLR